MYLSRYAITLVTLLLVACSSAPESTGTEPILAEASGIDDWWQPKADQNLRWYWQLQDALNTSLEVDVYDIDIETPQPVIDKLKSRGIKLICYFSVGTVEHFRSDADQFPTEAIGDSYPGYDDEQWLDLANYSLFADIMRERLDRCAAKGFDGVEGDNVDAFVQRIPDENGVIQTGTNFKITKQQSVDYVRWLAVESHKRGMAFGLKNAEALAPDVINQVDWIITENCYIDDWCTQARLFIENNKPVFMTEYAEYLPDFTSACTQAREFGFSAIYRDTGLSASGIFKECL